MAEIAEYLGICDETIYTMVLEKQTPHIRVKCSTYINLSIRTF
ncbi:hypothetical protein [Collibacillus ludicampi]|nr:hypothetical protein [Collibacillus ludicampi]